MYEVINTAAASLANQAETWKQDHDEANRMAELNELFGFGLHAFQRFLLADGMVPQAVGLNTNSVRASAVRNLTRLFLSLATHCERLPVSNYDYEVSAQKVGQVGLALQGLRKGFVLWAPTDSAGAEANLGTGSVVDLEELRESLA